MRLGYIAVLMGLQVLFAGFFCDDADAHGDASVAPFVAIHAEHVSHSDFACPDVPDDPLWLRAGGNPAPAASQPAPVAPVVRRWAGADVACWPAPAVRGVQAFRAAPSLALLSRLLI
ncbi:hypothetical protein IIA16_00825 [bacterium]|nr:hypothetical protein [bacterium]